MTTMTDAPTAERVVVYADGFGRWYARVDFTEPVGPHFMLHHQERLRAKARRAIRRQIVLRQSQPVPPVRLEVADDLFRHGTSPDHMNQWWSITYREKETN